MDIIGLIAKGVNSLRNKQNKKRGIDGNINLESFVLHNYSKENITKYAFVGLGQGGGKLAIDFNLLNFYVSLFDSVNCDLKESNQRLQKNNGSNPSSEQSLNRDEKYINAGSNYSVTPLFTSDGAKIDCKTGNELITDNIDILKRRLVQDTNISGADFVWVTASLGGATASNAVADMVKIISGFIRQKGKRFGYRESGKKQKALPGTPTVGVIALWPEDSCSPKVKLSAARTLQELVKLQEKGLLGNIFLIDNQLFIDEAINSNISNWQKICNARIIEFLTETLNLTNMSSSTSVDKAGLMDIITQPGFLKVSKTTFKTSDIYKKNTASISTANCRAVAEKIVNKSNFTDIFDEDIALKSIFMTLSYGDDPAFKRTAFSVLCSEMTKIHRSAIVHHYGKYKASEVDKSNRMLDENILQKHKLSVKPCNSKENIAYHMSVYKNLPNKYIEISKKAKEEFENNLREVRHYGDSFLTLRLDSDYDLSFAGECCCLYCTSYFDDLIFNPAKDIFDITQEDV